MAREKFKNVILVLVYGKRVEDSYSYQALICYAREHSDSAVVFWNNGPEKLNYIPVLENIFFNETLENKSLSCVYNCFIERWYADSYLLLDDDSIVDNSFLESFSSLSNDLAVPVIWDEGIAYYPLVNGVVIDHSQEYLINDVSLMSIGSGLIVKRKIIDKLRLKFETVFDERFNIYGVDTSFFYRLNMIDMEDCRFEVIPSIKHSLSKNKQESKDVMHFRARERSRDIALTLIHYRAQVNVYRILLSVVINSFLATLGWQKKHYSIRSLAKFLLDVRAREYGE